MMRYKLLESIGSVDDDLLQECENAKYVHKSLTFKVLLTSDADWNVVEDRKTAGYRLEAVIETVQDAPMKLVYPYLPTVPDDWKWSEIGSAKYDGKYGMIGITWIYTQERTEYKVFYRQESVYFYNARETPTVWDLLDVPEDVVVTGEAASIGEVRYIVSRLPEQRMISISPAMTKR